MWLMKRVIVDGWQVEPAVEEATALGMTNEAIKKFMLDQIAARRK
jgi:hypothetical protein